MMDEYCIPPNASILDAMRKIDSAAISTVVVCQGGRVDGVLTDGDIRRAILRGHRLTDSVESVYTRKFVSVDPGMPRADVLELMQARVIEQIPIIGANGELVGIHTLRSIVGHAAKSNWAVIMAGGKGTRLGKLTESTPKPMLRVAGKPILERIVLHLVTHGFRTVFLAINHLSHVIEQHFGDGSRWGCQITYLREDEPLGSGGAISLLPRQPEQPLLLMNGDLLLEADFSRMLEFHEGQGFYATMGVHCYSHEVPFGCIETEGRRIVALEEKPVLTRTINAGVYVLSPRAVGSVPQNTFFPATAIFEDALARHQTCGAYPLDGDWIDVGLPEQLKQARGQR